MRNSVQLVNAKHFQLSDIASFIAVGYVPIYNSAGSTDLEINIKIKGQDDKCISLSERDLANLFVQLRRLQRYQHIGSEEQYSEETINEFNSTIEIFSDEYGLQFSFTTASNVFSEIISLSHSSQASINSTIYQQHHTIRI